MVLHHIPNVTGLARRQLLCRGVNSPWRAAGHHDKLASRAMSRAGARSAAFSQSARRQGDEKDTQDAHSHSKHPRPPECTEPETFSQEFEGRIPSNRARPTLSDAYQHSGVDSKHPRRPAKEEWSLEERARQEEMEQSVKKHNAEVEMRYDRACAQVDREGNVDMLGKDCEVDIDEKGKVKARAKGK